MEMAFEKILEIIRRDNFKADDYTFLADGISGDVYEIHGFAVKFRKYHSSIDYVKEAEKLKQLEHTGFVPIVYHVEKDFIMMELIKGKTLCDYFEDGNDLTSQQYQHIQHIIQVFEENGIYVNDIHDENIMILPNGVMKFIDAGEYATKDDEKYLIDEAKESQGEFFFMLKKYHLKKENIA